jgi:hypothetical protein
LPLFVIINLCWHKRKSSTAAGEAVPPAGSDTADTVAIHFIRISEAGMLPLIAELLIDRVSTNLNGTDVLCLPSNDSDRQTTFAIHVLGGWWRTNF